MKGLLMISNQNNKNIDFRGQSSAVRSVIISLVFICIMCLMKPVQDTGDDAFMIWQVAQGKGSLASFVSPFFSLFVSYLYAYVPVVQWWNILPIIGSWILLFLMINFIDEQYQYGVRWFLYILVFVSVWLSIVKRVNFTRTALVFSLEGGLFFWRVFHNEKIGKRRKICLFLCASFLYLFGCMIRFQAALLVLPFFLICSFCKTVEKQSFGCLSRSNVKKMFYILWPIALSVFLFIADACFWFGATEWKKYNEYNSVRSSIVDYVEQYPTWDEARNQYEMLGLKDENDLNILFERVFVGDFDVFDLETLKGIKNLRKNDMDNSQKVTSMFERINEMLIQGKIIEWLFFLLLILTLFVGSKAWRVVGLQSVCAVLVLMVFSYLGRMMLRVWEPVVLCVIIWSIVYVDMDVGFATKKRKRNLGRKVLAFFTMMWLVHSTGLFVSISQMSIPKETDDRDSITRARIEYISSMPERIYLLSEPLIHHSPNPGFFGIWEPVSQTLGRNYFAISNWEARTPTNINRLKKEGIDNPATALFERKDIYSNLDNWVFDFLRTHYATTITCSIVDKFPDDGYIIQYLQPIIPLISNQNSVFLINSIEIRKEWINGRESYHVEGVLDSVNSLNLENVYLNAECNGVTYTWRIMCGGNGEFEGGLYGTENISLNDVYLFMKDSKGEYVKFMISEDVF